MNKSEELDFLELVVRYQDHSLDELGVAFGKQVAIK